MSGLLSAGRSATSAESLGGDRVQLDPDDVEAIARRVLALLRDEIAEANVRFVDAKALAVVLDVDRSWVYAHAAELHAIRLGDGRGRLRFDLEEVQRCLAGHGNGNGNGAPRKGRRRASRRRSVMDVGGELLPIEP